MRHLFGTWSAVFPTSVLRRIGSELQFTMTNQPTSGSSDSQSRPTHGIHVNPKYLEARRLEHSTAVNDVPDARGISSRQQQYGQKPAFGLTDFEGDHLEVVSQKVGKRRLGSPGISARTSFLGGAERDLASKSQLLRSSSPSRVGPAESLRLLGSDFPMDGSPGRAVERASPSHRGLEFGLSRVHRREGESTDWWKKHLPDDNHQQRESSSPYNRRNGYDQQRPRALIDAYGSHKVSDTYDEKPLKIDRLDLKSINSEAAIRRWQNTEEEEYRWEDMSPTLSDRSRSDLPLRNSNGRMALGRPNASVLEPDYGRPSHGTISRKSVGILGTPSEATQIQGSDYAHEPWKVKLPMPQSLPQLDQKAIGKAAQAPFLPVGTVPMSQKVLSIVDAEIPSTMGAVTSIDTYFGQRPRPSLPPLVWPPINSHTSHPPVSPFIPPPLKQQIRGQFDLLDTNKLPVNQGASQSLALPPQLLGNVERKPILSTSNLLPPPNQLEGLPYNQGHGQVSLLPPHLIRSQEAQGSSFHLMQRQASSHLVTEPSISGRFLPGQSTSTGAFLLNQLPGLPSSVAAHGMPITPFQLQGSMVPPLPPGPPPVSSQMRPTSQVIGPAMPQQPVGAAFSGLINSLMAQGLISLNPSGSVQDSVGVDFNPDLLKVRHESAISALFADLPRQCTTCGLRFKCQEAHRSHMDWHVTKNRVSKNRKQKPSRKWFVSTSVWLSGAEAVGAEAVPGFLPAEPVVEKKDDEELAVPADENQDTCALCGEPFDDFYSDETEEWMYKGAVYQNAPNGSIAGIDRSQLGPIVHAKCRSESTVVPSEDFVLDEGGKTDDGHQRKRMRV
ncbi:hypothetical protein Scep_028739 [Stephania cephalantha]|uniref:C2H2-type domain-containing protein n=1 Tax=Stephania cephalantha TaxID=152367 RepID=A0AAP0EF35_9MAGN